MVTVKCPSVLGMVTVECPPGKGGVVTVKCPPGEVVSHEVSHLGKGVVVSHEASHLGKGVVVSHEASHLGKGITHNGYKDIHSRLHCFNLEHKTITLLREPVRI